MHQPVKEMHKCVFTLLAVLLLFGITFPLACLRVSQDKKLANYNFHLKSLTPEGKLVKAYQQTKGK
jgi:hypothetical protein